jgi:mannose-6-phosphate isomerase class I
MYIMGIKAVSNYEKHPSTPVDGELWKGWDKVATELMNSIKEKGPRVVVVVEAYQGVYHDELRQGLMMLNPELFIDTHKLMLSEEQIKEMTWPFITDDEIFGYMSHLEIKDFMDVGKTGQARTQIENTGEGLILIYGYGAVLVQEPDILVWADMARWEIQQRQRRKEVDNIGISNSNESFTSQYKRSFFLDWRVCDRLKKQWYEQMDYIIDTNSKGNPKMIKGMTLLNGLKQTVQRPFRVVPFFDPGPWGGQWMKEVCNLPRDVVNFAWCFDCVPEENSLLLEINGEIFETPSINLVFYQSTELLGGPVEARFGKEFPIRFDFLDTMEGGNLSFQVHPVTDYIHENFGMHYTQDESYYILDAAADGTVYLGLKKGIDPMEMIRDLKAAQDGGPQFNADLYANKFPAKKHDHFLIPAGTIHCSGKNSMVLEISATPYIFTFKLWDWGRLGLDGKPRPINIGHGEKVINWHWDTEFVKGHLINRIQPIGEGDGWREEKTGLHENEFIETRRHWFTKKVLHNTNGGVNVLNLVEGREAIIESPTGRFEPFIVHYAETFIVPAVVGEYTIRPYGESEGKEIATIKAFVRG